MLTLDLTVWALRRRPDNQVDYCDGETFRRALALNGKVVEIAVAQTGLPDSPRLEVKVSGVRLARGVKSAVTAALDRLLGLKVNLSGFYRLAADDRRLRPLAERFRGLKPPRFPSVFEALANGIACQQVSLTLGIRLLNRLAEPQRISKAVGKPGATRAATRPALLTMARSAGKGRCQAAVRNLPITSISVQRWLDRLSPRLRRIATAQLSEIAGIPFYRGFPSHLSDSPTKIRNIWPSSEIFTNNSFIIKVEPISHPSTPPPVRATHCQMH